MRPKTGRGGAGANRRRLIFWPERLLAPGPGRARSGGGASRLVNESPAPSGGSGSGFASGGRWIRPITPGGGAGSSAADSTTRPSRGVSGIGVLWSTLSSAGSYARCAGGRSADPALWAESPHALPVAKPTADRQTGGRSRMHERARPDRCGGGATRVPTAMLDSWRRQCQT